MIPAFNANFKYVWLDVKMPVHQKHHVVSGSYFVGNSQPLLLEALLGTCVGVAAYDEVAGCGGLMHLLLPEQVVPGSTYQPEKYATTGLPIFIKALLDAGASLKNLRASIAGGALVGPLDERDISLDIGGRTAEIAYLMLTDEGITIERAETGGFYTSAMSLNMKTWEISIKPAGEEKFKPDAEAKIPTSEEISYAIDHIQPIPQVALKILRMINEDDYNILEIANEVRQDQVITAHTLRVCNSAYFTKAYRIDSLDHALALLGRDVFIRSIISAVVKQFYKISSSGYSLLKGGIYHHAVGTAIVAERLANFVGNIPPAVAYTAGLLHDIGKVILDQYVASSYPLFYRSLQKEKNFMEIEKEILGTDHTEVGSILAEKWNFPESLTGTIRYHHRPENEQTFSDIAHVVYLSDLLMSRFHAGFEIERLNTDTFVKRIEKIGLTVPQLLLVIDLIPSELMDLTAD